MFNQQMVGAIWEIIGDSFEGTVQPVGDKRILISLTSGQCPDNLEHQFAQLASSQGYLIELIQPGESQPRVLSV